MPEPQMPPPDKLSVPRLFGVPTSSAELTAVHRAIKNGTKESRDGRVLKKHFSLPLADARGSVTAAESMPAFPNRDDRRSGKKRFSAALPVCPNVAKSSPG
jgi:hypothetical protein